MTVEMAISQVVWYIEWQSNYQTEYIRHIYTATNQNHNYVSFILHDVGGGYQT